MKTKRNVVMIALALSVLVLAGGCRSVKLQVTNVSNELLPVTVTAKGLYTDGDLGNIGPAGDTLEKTLWFYRHELPTNVTVKVGKLTQRFVVNKTGKSVFRVDLKLDNKLHVGRGKGSVKDEKEVKVKVPIGEAVEVIE